MLEIYWIMLIPITLFCICLEFFKMPDGTPQAGKIIKRVVVSMILLFTFDETMQAIAMICDGIADKINGIKGIQDLLGIIESRFEDFTVSWFKAKEAIVFIIAFLSYLIAYVSVFLCNVLIHFVWSLLFICSPLMILLMIPEQTAHITKNLYKGLFNVASWKIVWSILGVMLLKIASSPDVGDWDSFMMTIIMNLCIAISMLFIPMASKSLFNDGMSSAATSMAAIGAGGTASMVKNYGAKAFTKSASMGRDTVKSGYDFTSSRLNNFISNLRNSREQSGSSFNQQNRPKDIGQNVTKPTETKPINRPSNVIKVDFNKGRPDDKK